MRVVTTLFFAFLTLSGASALAQTSGLPGQPREESLGQAGREFQLVAKLYPNPAVEYLNVSFEEPIARRSQLTVHNIIGNVLDVEMETIDEHEIRVKVKDLPVGYYLLAIRDDQSKGRSTLKFLKR